MDRKTALEKLGQSFEAEKAALTQCFIEQMERHLDALVGEIYSAIQTMGETDSVQMIQIQVMRTDVYQGKSRIIICGYNENWYLDENHWQSEVEAAYLYEPFAEMERRLAKGLSAYMGAVTDYDVRNLVCEHFIKCFSEQAARVRNHFALFDEWAETQGLVLSVPYRVLWGAYREHVETLFYMDKKQKGTKEFRTELKDNNLFRSFVESSVSDTEICGKNFAFLNMKSSALERALFTKCVFGQSLFIRASVQWCQFRQCMFYGCNWIQTDGYQMDFNDAQIVNTAFEEMKLRKGKFDGAILTDVSFYDAALEECSFRNATLTRVDLRVSSMENLDFTGAVLQDVYVHYKDADKLTLTEEQSEHVYVLEEERNNAVL